MPDARRLDDILVSELIPSGAHASAPTTASGSWVDISNYIGDVAIVVDVPSVTGSLGSLAVQAQVSAANTGASPANCVDARNSGLSTITAVGCSSFPINSDNQPANFLGVTCTYTGITAGQFSITIVGRKANN